MAIAPGIGPDTQADDAILDSLGFRLGGRLLGGMAGLYALATPLPKDDKPAWWDTWFYGIAILAVTLAGLARPLLVKRDRVPWLLLALAAISWAAGDQYWTIMFADADEIPLPSPADVGYLALYPLASVGLILLARSQLEARVAERGAGRAGRLPRGGCAGLRVHRVPGDHRDQRFAGRDHHQPLVSAR